MASQVVKFVSLFPRATASPLLISIAQRPCPPGGSRTSWILRCRLSRLGCRHLFRVLDQEKMYFEAGVNIRISRCIGLHAETVADAIFCQGCSPAWAETALRVRWHWS